MKGLVLVYLVLLALVDAEDQSDQGAITKIKRYLNHGLSHVESPCPPFYPHFHEFKPPMHLTKPYGPPAYPKINQHVQYVHQAPYVTQQIVKTPHYNYLPAKPYIPPAQWQYPPQADHDKLHFSYAPSFHKPMTHQVTYDKPVNYHVEKPGIIYKSESDNCEPCHQTPHYQPLHLPYYPEVSHAHVKPIIPAPFMHSPLIKPLGHVIIPCDKKIRSV